FSFRFAILSFVLLLARLVFSLFLESQRAKLEIPVENVVYRFALKKKNWETLIFELAIVIVVVVCVLTGVIPVDLVSLGAFLLIFSGLMVFTFKNGQKIKSEVITTGNRFITTERNLVKNVISWKHLTSVSEEGNHIKVSSKAGDIKIKKSHFEKDDLKKLMAQLSFKVVGNTNTNVTL
ncbi:MAG: hypothetical protein ACPG5P_04440, partial [Saprospiraceae bacterium]